MLDRSIMRADDLDNALRDALSAYGVAHSDRLRLEGQAREEHRVALRGLEAEREARQSRLHEDYVRTRTLKTAEQGRVGELLARVGEVEAAARRYIESTSLAFIVNSLPALPEVPTAEADHAGAVARAFAEAQLAVEDFRAVLLRYADASAAARRWDDARQLLDLLSTDPDNPHSHEADQRIEESYIAEVEAFVEAGAGVQAFRPLIEWATMRRGEGDRVRTWLTTALVGLIEAGRLEEAARIWLFLEWHDVLDAPLRNEIEAHGTRFGDRMPPSSVGLRWSLDLKAPTFWGRGIDHYFLRSKLEFDVEGRYLALLLAHRYHQDGLFRDEVQLLVLDAESGSRLGEGWSGVYLDRSYVNPEQFRDLRLSYCNTPPSFIVGDVRLSEVSGAKAFDLDSLRGKDLGAGWARLSRSPGGKQLPKALLLAMFPGMARRKTEPEVYPHAVNWARDLVAVLDGEGVLHVGEIASWLQRPEQRAAWPSDERERGG